jgi:hypothetical protein
VSLTRILAKVPAGKTVAIVWVTPDSQTFTHKITLVQIPPE